MRENMIYNPGIYQLREEAIKQMLNIIECNKTSEENGVVFYGDSIIEQYDIDKYYKEIPIKYNTGIDGFTSENLLWVCDEAVIKYNPKLVVILIGTNDLGNTCMMSPRTIAHNVDKLLDILERNLSNTKFIVLSTLPCNEDKQGPRIGKPMRTNRIIDAVNVEVKDICRKHFNSLYINVYKHLLNKENNNIFDIYSEDGLHLTEQGYDKFTEVVKPFIMSFIR